jgi:parvulin-like peptidyl-prolyl isomerase
MLYQSSGTEEEFLRQISQRGFTIDYVKEDIKTTLTIQKYIQEFVYKDSPVTEEEIQSEYALSDSATVRHILMLTQGKSQSEKNEIKKKMEDVLGRARSGEDFAQLAQSYSEDPGSKDNGGLYKKFPRGQMVKPFEDASFNLPIGSISDLVETQYGYHIIKVVDREKPPLKDLRDKIRNRITATKHQRAILANVESLKQKYQYEELLKP